VERLTGILFACNNHKPVESKNVVNSSEADDDRPAAKTEPLVLNNGAKWKVDISTNNNVNNIKGIPGKFNDGNDKLLAAYKKAYTDLQQAINKMIVECKMKGRDHEALHKWLEPLITQVANFKQASTAPDAAGSLKVIQAQVNLL
jgi:hypothetical protein